MGGKRRSVDEGQRGVVPELGCLIRRYTDPATDSVAVHDPLGNKVRYSLLLYGPQRYTYIALVTSIRLLLHAILLQLIRLAGNIRLISLHGNNPSLPLISLQGNKPVVTRRYPYMFASLPPRRYSPIWPSLHISSLAVVTL